MKKIFIGILVLGLLAGCSSNSASKTQDKSLTPEQKKAAAAEQNLKVYQKAVLDNQNIQKEIDKALVDMAKNATMQQVQGKDVTGTPETWYEYTFKNTSKYTFTMMQLGWSAVKKDGTETKDYSDPLNQVIKPNDTFKLHARLYSEAVSYKDIYLQGTPEKGTFKDVTTK
jgi:hypothetical protein